MHVDPEHNRQQRHDHQPAADAEQRAESARPDRGEEGEQLEVDHARRLSACAGSAAATIGTMSDSQRSGPLAGLRVLELSTVLAGPYCAMVLADLGADVIKVEPPEGDATRGYGPPWVGPAEEGGERVAAYFLSVNRNKRSLRLDLRREEAREVVRRLIGRSDVLVENFRPGGHGPTRAGRGGPAELNPRLVHLSITGYGPDGPDADKPGYDFVAQAVGGLMSVTGFADADGGRPTKLGRGDHRRGHGPARHDRRARGAALGCWPAHRRVAARVDPGDAHQPGPERVRRLGSSPHAGQRAPEHRPV